MALEYFNSSLFIGRNHLRLKRVESTNNFAVDYITKSNPIEGTVISASYQYGGKGQIGRSWESEEGKNILCSTILKPNTLAASNQFYLNMAISLAVLDFCENYLDKDLNVQIKWPNDIYVGDKKIAGILIQNSLKGKFIQSSVIGTGINVNQVEFSDHLPNPVSLVHFLNKEIELQSAYDVLFDCLNNRVSQLYNGDYQVIRKTYLENLFRLNEWHKFTQENGTPFTAKIAGIDDMGQLVLESKAGHISSYGFREIRFVL